VGEKEKESQQVGERRRKNLSEFPSPLVGEDKETSAFGERRDSIFLKDKKG